MVNKIIKVLRTLKKWVLVNLIDKVYLFIGKLIKFIVILKIFNKSYNNSTLKRTLG